MRAIDVIIDEELNISDTTSINDEQSSVILSASASSSEASRAECAGNKIRYLLANARLLANKFDSLVDKFRELDLHLAMVNETWLKNDRETEEAIKDIKDNEGLEIIKKNRSTRGGGVAIIYDGKQMKLKRHSIPGNRFELVCGIGRTTEMTKKIVVFSLYIPPKQKADTTKRMMECIANCIETLKCDLNDPYFIIGGDFNRRRISAIEDFADIKQSSTEPTRLNSCLDYVCDNMSAQYSLSEPCLLYTSDAADE